MSTFEDGLTQLMMQMEELKRSFVSSYDEEDERVDQYLLELEAIIQQLEFLLRKMLDDPEDAVKRDMYAHCRQRAMETCHMVLLHVTREKKTTKQVFDQDDGQPVIARIAELSLLLNEAKVMIMDHPNQNQQHDAIHTQTIIQIYSNYQKAVLRQRCKPAIALLAHWRNNPGQALHNNNNNNEDDEDENQPTQPHSNAVTVILGQASALIHPLLLWKANLPPDMPLHTMCQSAICVLDEQAQLLTKTISDWFHQDKKLEEWMKLTVNVNPQKEPVPLAELDGLVEEMAFICQVLARYNALMQEEKTPYQTTIGQELLPEWTWKYASLERFLGMEQWKSALALATPVNIVVGSNIMVPSVVEDAQYLSSRGLDRATSTLSMQAMGTVAHSLSNDIWSTDITGGVHEALMEQRGCWVAPVVETKQGNPDSFASALLDALDEDTKAVSKTPPRVPSAPASGGFLGSLVLNSSSGQQATLLLRLETTLCRLNGIHSASVACTSLAQSLDIWLSQEEHVKATSTSMSSMIQLAREELERYSQTYLKMLEMQVKESLLEWCGSLDEPSRRKNLCIHDLREFFWDEDYELDNATFIKAESDARLDKVLLDQFRESPLVSHISKCDYDVSVLVCKELSILVADLVIRSLWGYNKAVTEWGSLLLSKQVRTLQSFLKGLVDDDDDDNVPPVSFLDEFEKLNQVVTILQLEKPSDWSIYKSTSMLTLDELKKTMLLRKEFSIDAITAICRSS